MPISTEKLRDLMDNDIRSIRDIDLLNEINERKYKYTGSATLAGKTIEVRYYEEPYFLNTSTRQQPSDTETQSTPTAQGNEGEQSTGGEYHNLSSDEKKEINIKRSNRRRWKQLANIIRCNTDILTTYMTLTMGDRDYSELLQNELENIYGDPLSPSSCFDTPEDVLEKLKGIKCIKTCDAKRDDRLDPEHNDLRKKVVAFLGSDEATGKRAFAAQKIKQQYADTVETRVVNQEIKRELHRQLNTLICTKDPTDLDDANALFRSFRDSAINRTLANDDDRDFQCLQYVRVTELQQNGKVHFHLLCNLPYIEQWKLQKKWNNGLVHITRVKNMELDERGVTIFKEDTTAKKHQKLTNYLAKEFPSNSRTVKFTGRRIFTASQGLRRTIKVRQPAYLDQIHAYLKKNGIQPDVDEYVEAQDEYGRSFRKKVYHLHSLDLYHTIDEDRKHWVKKMLALAEERGCDYVDQEIYDAVIAESPFKDELQRT